MSEHTDQNWIHLLKQDDPQADLDLWEAIFVWAETLARRYQQEEDLGRDSALAAYQRIKTRGIYQYQFRGPFLGFCRRIVVNEVNRLLPKNVPHLEEIDESKHATRLAHYDPEPLADAPTIHARLQPCLDKLRSNERQIVQLLYLEEKTPQEAADQLQITRNNTNVIVYRSRRKLLDCLQQLGYSSADDILSL